MTIRDNLSQERNHLTLHGVDIVELGNKYRTPLFVFDEKSILENFNRFPIKVLVPQVDENDMIVVFDCGAYLLSSSTQLLIQDPQPF